MAWIGNALARLGIGHGQPAPAPSLPVIGGRVDSGIGIQGTVETERMLLSIGGRLMTPAVNAEAVYAVLNKYFKRKWDRWNGFLVETGDLRASWTQNDAPHAIREAHGEYLQFGSDLYYNRFWTQEILGNRPLTLNDQIAEAYAEYFVPRDHISTHESGIGLGIMGFHIPGMPSMGMPEVPSLSEMIRRAISGGGEG